MTDPNVVDRAFELYKTMITTKTDTQTALEIIKMMNILTIINAFEQMPEEMKGKLLASLKEHLYDYADETYKIIYGWYIKSGISDSNIHV